METAYAGSHWRLPDDFLERESFDRALAGLDMSSTPGYPYMREAPTTGDWLKWDGFGSYDSLRVERLWYDTCKVLRGEWDTILRAFIKREPHSKKKCEDGRWRLILCSPLPVQVAWQMIFAYHNDVEIEKARYIPSQQGFKLMNGDWKRYYQDWVQRGMTWAMDKSAWDWTAPYWTIELDLEFRYRMGRGSMMDKWREKAEILYRQMFVEPKIILSDGSVYRQVVPGVMKSGCVNTISTNGHCQGFVHCVVCYRAGVNPHPLPRVVGDDTLSRAEHAKLSGRYSEFGVIVKEVTQGIEFVGFNWSTKGLEPLYFSKHISRFRHTGDKILPEYIDSLLRVYVHSRHYGFWERAADVLVGGALHNRAYYKYWMDYGES